MIKFQYKETVMEYFQIQVYSISTDLFLVHFQGNMKNKLQTGRQ